MLWRSRRGRRYPPRATVLHDPTAAITPQRRDSHGLVAARAAMARRDLAAAEAALLTHLRAHPHDADALVECAEFSFRSGRPDRACWALAKALALFPGSARWHGQLGYANLAVGDHDAARESFERALTLAPDDPAANYGLASCCQRERRWPAAAAALERALAPAGAGDAFAIVLELIGVLCQAGAFDAARRHCEQAARLAPAEPALWYATARLELAGGRPALALAAIERCLRATPDEPRIVLEKARCLRALDDPAQAWLWLARLTGDAGNAPDVEHERGHCRHAQGAAGDATRHWLQAIDGYVARDEFAAASALLDHLLAIAPGSAVAWHRRGKLEQARGDAIAAAMAWRQAIACDPNRLDAAAELALALEAGNRLSDAAQVIAIVADRLAATPAASGAVELHLVQARLARRGKDSAAAFSALAAVDAGATDASQRRHAAFERGKLQDACGDVDAAMTAFTDGNALALAPWQRAHPGRNKALAGVEYMLDLAGNGWLGQWPAIPDLPPHRDLAFLIGFPRSGTTLLNQVLDGHPAICAIEEKPTVQKLLDAVQAMPGGYPQALPTLDAIDIAWLRRIYARATAAHGDDGPARLLLDKFPMNTLLVGLLHRVFPQAKFVFALRHPCDVVLSCFMQDFSLNNTMANFCTLADAVRMYTRTMELWQHYRAALPLAVHAIRYEDVVDDFDGQVQALCGFLGVPWREDLRDFSGKALARGRIDTPSYEQVSRPIYRDARYRWLHYRKYLEPQLPALQPWIERFGYGLVDAGAR